MHLKTPSVDIAPVKLYPYVKSKTQTQMHELASCFCPYQLYPYDTLCTYGVKQLKLLGFSQRHLFGCSLMEQGTGVEPASAAWEAAVLPMYEPCLFDALIS